MIIIGKSERPVTDCRIVGVSFLKPRIKRTPTSPKMALLDPIVGTVGGEKKAAERFPTNPVPK